LKLSSNHPFSVLVSKALNNSTAYGMINSSTFVNCCGLYYLKAAFYNPKSNLLSSYSRFFKVNVLMLNWFEFLEGLLKKWKFYKKSLFNKNFNCSMAAATESKSKSEYRKSLKTGVTETHP